MIQTLHNLFQDKPLNLSYIHLPGLILATSGITQSPVNNRHLRVSRKKHVPHHKNYHVQRTQRVKKNTGQNITSPSKKKKKKHSQKFLIHLGFARLRCPLFHLFAADLTFGLRKDDTNQVGSSSNGTLGIFWATHATDLGDPTLRGWRQYGGGENWMFKVSIGNIT